MKYTQEEIEKATKRLLDMILGTENNISKDIDLPIPQKDDEYKQCWICSKDKVEEKTKLGWTHNSYIIPKEFIEMLLQGYSLILFDGDYTSEIKMEDNYEQKI